MLARAVVVEPRAVLGAALEVVRLTLARSTSARTATSCSGRASCDAQAIASSSAGAVHVERKRLQRLRRGERTKASSRSPQGPTTASPSLTTTACARWRDSTSCPLVTATLSASTRRKTILFEFPEVEAARQRLDEPIASAPVAKAGPAHVWPP